jgi:pentatricopeptide repeat protein
MTGYGRMLRSVPDLDRTWSSLLKESQKGRLLIDSRVYQAAIRGYCRAGHIEKAWTLWNHAVKSFESGKHQPHVSIVDSHLCASVIFELNLARQSEKSQQIFQWMKSAGVRVDDRVRTALAARPRHSVDKPPVKTAAREL